jgi:hypothetical protein
MSRIGFLLVTLMLAVVAACSSVDPSKLTGTDPTGTSPPSPSSPPSSGSDASPPDGTAPPDDAGTDAGSTTTSYNTPVVCTSGVTNSGSGSSMHPGGACNACHQKQGAPIFSIAGTVYPTAHEPDDCYGVASNAAEIVVLDSSNNTQLTLYTTGSGNFSTTAVITTPYRIKVLANGKERDMAASETTGDCNSCHTESGTSGAPGRIMSP